MEDTTPNNNFNLWMWNLFSTTRKPLIQAIRISNWLKYSGLDMKVQASKINPERFKASIFIYNWD